MSRNIIADTVQTGVSGAIAGVIGTFFAPASAAAAGGTLKTMGACALGGAITFIPSIILLAPIHCGLIVSINNRNLFSTALCMTLEAAAIVGTIFMGTKIGAGVLGVSSSAVFTCAMVGVVALVTSIVFAAAILCSLANSRDDNYGNNLVFYR